MFSFFRKKIPPLPPLKKETPSFLIVKHNQVLCAQQFEEEVGFSYIPQLDFADAYLFDKLQRKGQKLQKKGKLSTEQLWLGSFYRKEIELGQIPLLSLRWIDPILGWGVFAETPFKKRDFIAAYAGKVRRWRRSDQKNSYCFEYVPTQGIATPYTIDASLQGGIARFINHSDTPNLTTALATIEGISHVVIYAIRPIQKGEQLCYDYGPAYWSKRKAPLSLGNDHPAHEIGKSQGNDSGQ